MADASGASVHWSTGDTTVTTIVKDTGLYWVSVNEKQCYSSDTFKVSYKQCGCEVSIPNAFSPNDDGLNDKFCPLFVGEDCAQSKYVFYVYNRWGQTVYQGHDSSGGWDGFYDGAPADMGTYFYLFQFTNADEKKTLKGDVVLLK